VNRTPKDTIKPFTEDLVIYMYRKYYSGVGNPLLEILRTIGNQELFTYYAGKYRRRSGSL
jgi:hypothetical protein